MLQVEAVQEQTEVARVAAQAEVDQVPEGLLGFLLLLCSPRQLSLDLVSCLGLASVRMAWVAASVGVLVVEEH